MRTPLGSHEAAGEPTPLIVDSRFIGWAMGDPNAVRSRQFTKDAMQPRTLGKGWEYWTWHPDNEESLTALGAFLELADPSLGHRFTPSLWPEGIYQPISNFERPLREIAKGTTGSGDDEAWD